MVGITKKLTIIVREASAITSRGAGGAWHPKETFRRASVTYNITIPVLHIGPESEKN